MHPVTKTGLKLGTALLALEATARYGVWKDSASSAAGYEDARESFIGTVVPHVKPYVQKIPFPEVSLPRVDWTEKWNSGVISTFSSIARLPSKTAELSSRGKDAVVKLFDKQNASAELRRN